MIYTGEFKKAQRPLEKLKQQLQVTTSVGVIRASLDKAREVAGMQKHNGKIVPIKPSSRS